VPSSFPESLLGASCRSRLQGRRPGNQQGVAQKCGFQTSHSGWVYPIQGNRKVPETESNCGFKQSKQVDVTSKKKARSCVQICSDIANKNWDLHPGNNPEIPRS